MKKGLQNKTTTKLGCRMSVPPSVNNEVSIVLLKETTDYRSVAQRHWNLTDEQMRGMHVHHEPPAALGGRNIPEHLYVCSPEMHLGGWHKGAKFPMMASEGGRLSAIVRRKNAKERAKLSDEEKEELKKQKKERVKKRKEKEKKKEEHKQKNYPDTRKKWKQKKRC